MGIRSAFTGSLAALAVRMSLVVMPVVAAITVRVNSLAGVLMMPERHALTGRHRGHALDGNGKND
jgi:hypothetical protein